MSQGPQDVDALLADVDALADSAVSEILGSAADAALPEEAPSEPAPSVATNPQRPRPKNRSASPVIASGEDVDRILHLQVPIIVQLAERTIRLSEILDLTTGSIIEFDKPADSELDLMINNKCLGRGQAVKVNENFGLRVTSIGSVRSRIQALGGA